MRLRIAWVGIAVLSTLALACGSRSDAAKNVVATTAASSVAATSGGPAPPPPPTISGDLTVFAASSLTDAFTEIGAEFQRANPKGSVRFNFGSSSMLRTQLEQGARADLFASADQIQMDAAKKAGVIQGDERIFVKNKLVLIYPVANPGKVSTIQDLAKPGLKVVLTDKAVPIGAYARAALEKMSAGPQFGADFSQKVLANLKSEEANVRAVVTKVQLGEADAGIVYASDVSPGVSKDIATVVIPEQFNTVANYPIAAVRDAKNLAAARAFIVFVRSAAGQAILRKNNFIIDGETGSSGSP